MVLYLYISSNDSSEDTNRILRYSCDKNGILSLSDGGSIRSGGEGINNNTHGKLGPNDNDTPLVIDRARKLLFSVNGHSDTIAVLKIDEDGALSHVEGSPFHSHGVMPNSLSIAGDTLLASNRNEDYHRPELLRDENGASYVSFKVDKNGHLNHVEKILIAGGHKPTQIHFAQSTGSIAFGNDFQVDADFDGDGTRSLLAGAATSVQGQLHSFVVSEKSELTEIERIAVPETNGEYSYLGMDGVPSLPLGLWTHPTQNILYVGFVTRNEVGVFEFVDGAKLKFVGSVKNSGQDICWLLTNRAGTRLYTINNLPRKEYGDSGSSVTTYDITGDKARLPVEIHRIVLPSEAAAFRNNRNLMQPGSTAFQCCLSPSEEFLFVIAQRINQTEENTSTSGNGVFTLLIDENGVPSAISDYRDLLSDGVAARCRPQGLACLEL